MQELQKNRGILLAQFRKIVRGQLKIAKVEDVASGILKFEDVIRQYVQAGGERPNDKEMTNDLLDTLPQEIRETNVWGTSHDEPFAAYRDHVRTAADDALYHRGRPTSPINNIEDERRTEQLEEVVGGNHEEIWLPTGEQ